jgi:glycosyltransferase involved in cell wall biosynthesis
MHVLYVHQNFPAQFGHIARHLLRAKGWRCTFVSQTPGGVVDGVEKVQYKLAGGATRQNHYCSRTFENAVWHTDAVYQALKARPDLSPDLIVGHSGFGSTLFLRELYPRAPIVNFFEYFYSAHDSDMDFRQDLPWKPPPINHLRSRCRNAMILLDLSNCDAAYTPTEFQRSRFPAEYQPKLHVIFDGVDRALYHGHEERLRPPVDRRSPRTIAGASVSADTRIVTYVSRGFESMRGFDIFMRAARRIAQLHPNVLFFVVGEDRVAYGGDMNHLDGAAGFKAWLLSRESFDLTKFIFTGRIPPEALAELLAASDLHIYLTVPFVLSWSMMDAMSCGAVVLGSATAPVQEMIRDSENGLLADFFDVEGIAQKAVAVLRDPAAFRPLGRAAERLIADRYGLEAVIPAMVRLYEEAITSATRRASAAPAPPSTPPSP